MELVIFKSRDNIVHIFCDIGEHCIIQYYHNTSEIFVDVVQVLLIN